MKMSAKRKREVLDDIGRTERGDYVTNSHSVCAQFNPAKRKVFIARRLQDNGRAFQSAAWQVVGVGFETDPKGHWRDYGNKAFDFRRATQQRALEDALCWATERGYGEDWDKDPSGGYQTRDTLDAMDLIIADHLAKRMAGSS